MIPGTLSDYRCANESRTIQNPSVDAQVRVSEGSYLSLGQGAGDQDFTPRKELFSPSVKGRAPGVLRFVPLQLILCIILAY